MSQKFKDDLKDLKEEGELSYFEYQQLVGMEDLSEKMDELSEKMDNKILELKNIDISLGDLERQNNKSGIMKIKKEVSNMPEQFKIDILKSHQEKNLVIISTTNQYAVIIQLIVYLLLLEI